MAGQVGKLTLEAVIKGFEDVQGLGKVLKQVGAAANTTDASFKGITERIKTFGRATIKTNEGLKGQIAAFEKLRGKTAFQGRAYNNLTQEIRALNKELRERVGLEREMDAGGGGIKGLLGGTKSRRLYPEKQPKEDTLKYLLGTQYFGSSKESERIAGTIGEFSKRLEKLQRGFTEVSWDDLSGNNQAFLRQLQIAAETQYEGLGNRYGKDLRGIADASVKSGSDLSQTGVLNKYQMQALGREENLDIRGKSYLDLVTKITGEQQTQNHLLEKVNNRSAEDLATQRAKTRQIAEQNKLNLTHIKSSVYQDYVKGIQLDSRKNRTTSPATMFGMKGRDIDPETKRWKAIDGFFRSTSIIADEVLGIKGTKLTEDLDRFRFAFNIIRQM